MRALGLRAEPLQVHWAIVEGDADKPVLVGDGKITPPESIEKNEAAVLNWYRKRIELLVNQHGAEAVGVRYQETHGRRGNVDAMCRRSRIEGVLTEVAFALGTSVTAGGLVQLGARLETNRAKHYLEDGDLRGIDLSSLAEKRREAVLAGVAALALNRKKS